jgi:hypothetical protein
MTKRIREELLEVVSFLADRESLDAPDVAFLVDRARTNGMPWRANV